MDHRERVFRYSAVVTGLFFVAFMAFCASLIPWNGLRLKEEPFHKPAAAGDWKAMEDLLSKGVKIDAEDGNGNTALYYAVSHNHIDFAQKLVDRGADVFHRDHGGRGVLEVEMVTTDHKTLEWVRRTLEKARSKQR